MHQSHAVCTWNSAKFNRSIPYWLHYEIFTGRGGAGGVRRSCASYTFNPGRKKQNSGTIRSVRFNKSCYGYMGALRKYIVVTQTFFVFL